MTNAEPEPVASPTGTGATGPFDPPGVVWQRVSPRLRTARLLVVSLVFAAITAALAALAVMAGEPLLWLLLALPAALWLWAAIVIPRQVRAIGYAERADDLLIRKGVMFRSIVVVPYGRMQYVDVQAGPLARQMRIASLQLHTAAAASDATIDGLEPAEAERLRDRLASRGEARLAGL